MTDEIVLMSEYAMNQPVSYQLWLIREDIKRLGKVSQSVVGACKHRYIAALKAKELELMGKP